MKRWHVEIDYRSQVHGILTIEHDIEEIEELHMLVERGPDWNTIQQIRITLARVSYPNDSLEAASKR
jgi:hypothetical protein